MFGALLYAKLFSIPILVSYHTHIPQYIPQYTWAGLVEPMWKLIRFCIRAADYTLVVSTQSQVHRLTRIETFVSTANSAARVRSAHIVLI